MKWSCMFFLIFLFVQVSCQVSEQNVYEYYQSLPESFFYDTDLGEIKYTIRKKENAWVSESLAGYEIPAIVDIKNGYIEINDEGTGGGNINIKVVLFRKKDRSPLIGITKGGFNGIYFENSSSFYETKNKEWLKAEYVFPEMGIDRFLNEKYRKLNFEKDEIISPNLSSLLELPQFGTVVNVDLNFTKYDFLVESNHNPHLQKPFTDKEQTKLWEIIDNISIESFQLKFNKAVGKFEVIDSTFLSRAEIESVVSVEESVLNQVWELNEVKELAAYIDTKSNKKRNLKLIFEEKVENKPDFYLVRAVEDNGGNFVTHLIFLIHKNTFEMYRYDAVEDTFRKIDP